MSKINQQADLSAAASYSDTRHSNTFRAEQPFEVHFEVDLEAYKGFPELYEERKYQWKFTPQTLTFLDLPIELSYKKSSAQVRRPNRKELRKTLRTRELNLSLLRTSKLVNEEAAEIFYGVNEFRFSGLYGHVVAAAFAYTIGPRHLQWLSNLKIGMPFRARSRSVQIFSKEAAPHAFNALLGQTLFRYPGKGSWPSDPWFSNEAAFTLLTQTFRRSAHRLQTLTFVLPKDLVYDERDEGYWDAFEGLVRAKPCLRVQVACLDWDLLPTHWELIRMMDEAAFCHILWTEFGERGECGHSVTVKGKLRHDKDADPVEILGDVWRLFERW